MTRAILTRTSSAPENAVRRGGHGPTFFSGRDGPRERARPELTEELRQEIEGRLDEHEPDVELLALEQPAAETLRLYIDHPEGVDLALCEQVTRELRDLLASYSLEVSSPGLDRPLTKLEHYHRFRGRRVRVRTRERIDGQRSFTGTLADADEHAVRLEGSDGPVEIPFSGIHRSNLVPELPEVPR